MKRFIEKILSLLMTILFSCSSIQDCPEKTNLLPMYGKLKKCDEQLKIDKEFLGDCDKYFKDRNEATWHHINKGWEYFYKNDFDTAMMRFNQAWLLDSTNADVYWGFGNILGKQNKFKESIPYFDKSLKLNPENSKVWLCAATSYCQLFFQSKNISFLDKAINSLKMSVSLDSTNPEAYAQLTACYAYYVRQDSARKYLKKTEKLDAKAINPELKRLLEEK